MMRMYKMLCMLGVLCMIFFSGQVQAQVVQKQTVLVNSSIEIGSPDGDLILKVTFRKFGEPTYALTYKGKTMLQDSPLGLVTNVSDFTKGLMVVEEKTATIDKTYKQDRIKKSQIHYVANELVCKVENDKKQQMEITFRVSNNNVAFRYTLLKRGETGSVRVMSEATSFQFPEYTTTFLTPQSDAMIGWKRTKPSYEEGYKVDASMNEKSGYGHGYTFPCLFKVGEDGWVLVSETDVDSRYCASHLSDAVDGKYTIAYPMPEENNGNGTVEPAIALPGATPWRTITLGETLKPIVETTVAWDFVEPLYEPSRDYQFGKGTWSWIVWQDASICMEDQKKYIDMASEMGFKYNLVDNWWDTYIGRDGIKELVSYARERNVELFLWYSSSGWWNDIEQGPVHVMSNPILRKKEMKWMRDLGVKGIKVDFFGGDKQETLAHYEAILSDADEYGLMVIFHGCTLPRGWEKMYPNYVGSEAVRASENLVFSQYECDQEAQAACLHPFIRNAVGCMEFGGCFMNERLERTNSRGTIRRTTDVFQLATCVLFQNPIQNFALAPNNMQDAPKVCLDFLREVPTTWDSVLAMFKQTLEHEKKVTSLIRNLADIAAEDKDYAASNRLVWFLDEQVEEEESARDMIAALEAVDGNKYGLYMLDKEQAARTYVAPSPLAAE